MLPGRKSKALRDSLLRQLLDDGATSVAEQLRPLVERDLNLVVSAEQYRSWNSRVSWALIDMRDEGLVISPFEDRGTPASREWIRKNRPGRDDTQQVWRLTSGGKAYLSSLGDFNNGVFGLITSEEAVQSKEFRVEGIEDARKRIISAIVSRRGQPRFRRQLLSLYNSRCAVTRADAVDALEAAHIVPYKGDYTDHPSNGLILRADVHTLFDLGLIAVTTPKMTVIVSSQLAHTVYADFSGERLHLPDDKENWPSSEALEWHRLAAGL